MVALLAEGDAVGSLSHRPPLGEHPTFIICQAHQEITSARIGFTERSADNMDKIILKTIENDHIITTETNPAFLCEFQKAVLLALLENETLTEMQYRCAEEKLRSHTPAETV